MRLLKGMCAVSTCVIAAALINFLCVQPYQCNILKMRIERQERLLSRLTVVGAPNFAVVARLRENVKLLRAALRTSPTDVDLYLELAAQYRFQQRPLEAAEVYKVALRYHRRPEIFLNLAESQFAAGRIAESRESYAWLLAFNPEEKAGWMPNDLVADAMVRATEIRAQIAQ